MCVCVCCFQSAQTSRNDVCERGWNRRNANSQQPIVSIVHSKSKAENNQLLVDQISIWRRPSANKSDTFGTLESVVWWQKTSSDVDVLKQKVLEAIYRMLLLLPNSKRRWLRMPRTTVLCVSPYTMYVIVVIGLHDDFGSLLDHSIIVLKLHDPLMKCSLIRLIYMFSYC